MYYLQISFSIILVLSIFGSLAYLLWLSAKVATQLMDRKAATSKAFMVSLITCTSIFIFVILWQDKSNWTLETWIMVLMLLTSISMFFAAISAFGLWYRNK